MWWLKTEFFITQTAIWQTVVPCHVHSILNLISVSKSHIVAVSDLHMEFKL